MDRRDFLKLMAKTGTACSVFGWTGCGREHSRDAQSSFYAVTGERVILYDVYAMALYMDGGLGPKTGIIKVDFVLANLPVKLEFWHGHGGKNHSFTVTPDHFAQLKQLKKVTLQTDVVADHSHKLFIDPVDPKWRVPGSNPVEVPVPLGAI